ncbi:MAG: hypothetical protein CK424_04735 [Legionella sp.]|nr:MAG: hypothetical protein CK424_04735 [Legionella sp.]
MFNKPTPAFGQFFLLSPKEKIGDDMTVIGMFDDGYSVELYIERGLDEQKSVLFYSEDKWSRQAIVPQSTDFDSLPKKLNSLKICDDTKHQVFILNQEDYTVFYNKLEEHWWKKTGPKFAFSEALKVIDEHNDFFRPPENGEAPSYCA